MVISFFMPSLLLLHVQSFLDYLKYQKRYSRHTVISYQNDLTGFIDFLELQYQGNSLESIKPIFIRSWLAQLKNDGMASKSINRKISTLKSFFKYLLKQGIITASPMTTIISPKVSKKLPQFVEKKDTTTLFNYVEFPDDWSGKTQRLILEILYNTGVRQAELLNLKENDVDTMNASIKVLGKGNKQRIIPISNELIKAIKNYISEKKLKGEGGFLLVNEKGKKLYPKYIYNTAKKYLALVTTISKKSPHILRHSFATHLANNGAELNAIKELLGHSSLAATQIYTHNTIDKLKEIHSKAHPKA